MIANARNIVVNNENWKWSCGKHGHINAVDSNNKRFTTFAWTLLGIVPDEWTRAYWDRSSYKVTPSMIAEWIKGLTSVKT